MACPGLFIIRRVAILALGFGLSLLAACATLTSDFDPPTVSMQSFRLLQGDSSVPRFEIKLRVTNPNTQSLDIAGISYDIEVRDKKLLSGVTNDIPVIEGYSDAEVVLQADLQWLQLLRLVAGLAQEELKSLDYQFSAKIDFNGLMPTQRIKEQGTFDFTQGNLATGSGT